MPADPEGDQPEQEAPVDPGSPKEVESSEKPEAPAQPDTEASQRPAEPESAEPVEPQSPTPPAKETESPEQPATAEADAAREAAEQAAQRAADADAVLRDPERTGDAGTRPRVVAMHAVRGGSAPGNAFFEPGARNPAVAVAQGDELLVDGVAYVVESIEVTTKSDAARSPAIWGFHPDGENRLAVLTCLQRAGGRGPSPENLVLHAVRA